MGGKAPFFVFRGGHGDAAVRRVPEGADGEAVALLGIDSPHDRADVPGGAGIPGLRFVHEAGPGGGNRDFVEACQPRVHGGAVHADHFAALVAIGFLDGGLHVVHRLVHWQHAGELEEGGLEDAVGPVPQADGLGGGARVDGVEFCLPLRQKALDFIGKAVFQVRARPVAVEEEGPPLFQLVYDVVFVDVALVVAGDEVRHGDVVGRENGGVAEAEVAFRHAAGFFRVVLKVGLDVLVRVVPDDLDGVFVSSHGAVGPQAPELAADGPLIGGDHVLPHGQGVEGHVVGDAHGEVVLLLSRHVVVDGDHLGGGGILAGKAVPPSQHLDPSVSLLEDGTHVLIKGLAPRAGLLGPVQDGQTPAALRQGGQEVPGAEGTVQPDLEEADSAALGV